MNIKQKELTNHILNETKLHHNSILVILNTHKEMSVLTQTLSKELRYRVVKTRAHKWYLDNGTVLAFMTLMDYEKVSDIEIAFRSYNFNKIYTPDTNVELYKEAIEELKLRLRSREIEVDGEVIPNEVIEVK